MKKHQKYILFVGLDNSGKSTILKTIQGAPADAIVPTVGVSLEKFTKGNTLFTVFDMSGHGQYRDLWRHYFNDVHAIVVVIDTTDKVRISILRDQLDEMLEDATLQRRKIPICFFANKMDLPGLDPAACSMALGLDMVKDRNWSIFASNAITGAGLDEGLLWLMGNLNFN